MRKLLIILLFMSAVNADECQDGYSAANSKDYLKALENWKFCVSHADNKEAEYNIGQLYQFGLGVSVDNISAMQWYLKAANKGFIPAKRDIGVIYEESKPAQYLKAYSYYIEAAKAGDMIAQYRLGLMLCKGLGVLKDYTEAKIWLQKAHVQGHTEAKDVWKEYELWKH